MCQPQGPAQGGIQKVDHAAVRPPLEWLSDIIWPSGTGRLVPGHDVAIAPARRLRWWASPSPQQAEILIPAGSLAAAGTASRRYHDGMGTARRLRNLTAELMFKVPPVARPILDGRVVEAVGKDLDQGILSELTNIVADQLDGQELHVAITLSRPKSNRKPVLQLLRDDGRCIGWAKVAANPWTGELIANEARWLGSRPVEPLVNPELIDELVIDGRRVLVMSNVAPARRWGRRNVDEPNPELIRQIAQTGSHQVAAVGDTAWWRSVEDVLGHADTDEKLAITQVLERATDRPLVVGAWHGDLAPWNIMSSPSGSGRLHHHVIDWEYAADEVPVGFDICHFHTQVGVEVMGRDATAALERSARRSSAALVDVGVSTADVAVVFDLYLVELIRRTLSLRAAGLPVDQITHGAAAAERILRADR